MKRAIVVAFGAGLFAIASRAAAEPVSPEEVERALDERNESAAAALRARELADRARRDEEAGRIQQEAKDRDAFDTHERQAADIDEDNAKRAARRHAAYVMMGAAAGFGVIAYLAPWRVAGANEDAITEGSLATSADIKEAARSVRAFEGFAYGMWAVAGATLVVASIIALTALPRSTERPRLTGFVLPRAELRF